MVSQNNIIITDHGAKRLKERTSYNKDSALDYLKKVWETGFDDFTCKKPAIKKYLYNIRKSSSFQHAVKVKGNAVYIFNSIGTVFITCYDIPQKILQDTKNKRKSFLRRSENEQY